MPSTQALAWLVTLCSCWALVGLIWTIQLNHYPAFRHVPPEGFGLFHGEHTRSITLVVMPLMLVELGTAAYLWLAAPSDWRTIVSLGLVVAVWAATFFVSVPYHSQLGVSKADVAVEGLILTNWWRTALWTVRGGLVAWVVWGMLPRG